MSRRSRSGTRRVSTEGSRSTGGDKGSTLKLSRMTSTYHDLGDGNYKVAEVRTDLTNELILLSVSRGKKGEKGKRTRIPIGLSVAEALEISFALKKAAEKILELRMYQG